MSLFRRKPKEEIIAVIDLGSASVGGMLIKKSVNSEPEIITSARVPINFLMDVDFQAFWRCTTNSLTMVINQLLKDFPKGPDKVLCVLSHFWVISQTRIIKIKKEQPFEIDKNFLDKIIDNEIKIFKMQNQNKVSDSKGQQELVEYKIMRTSLNGYEIKDPFNKTAKRFSVYIHIGLVENSIKKILENNILKNFGDVPVIFHSLPLIVFTFLKNIIDTDEGLIFINIGGETSDISLVRRSVLEETISFPRGKNFLIRKVASEFKTFINDAFSIINSYKEGHAVSSVSKKLTPIIEDAKNEWCGFLEKALKEISQESPLPKKIFVVSNKGAVYEFIECVKDESFAKFTILAKPFEIERVSPDALKNYFKFKRSFDSDNDVFLMIESLFADKFLD